MITVIATTALVMFAIVVVPLLLFIALLSGAPRKDGT